MKIIERAVLGSLLGVLVAWASIALAAPLPAASLHPDERHLLAALQKTYPGTRFTHVSRTPVAGLYEAWMGANVAFVAKSNVRYLVFGRLFDAQAMRDLTAPKLAQAERLQVESASPANAAPVPPFDAWPLADAIRIVRGKGGDGQRKLVVFSDPGCPYCRRLEAELDKLDNVTRYTFLLPFQGAALPQAIWCAADREKAWRVAMHAGEGGSALPTNPPAPGAASSAAPCAHPLDRNLTLARRLNVLGTPTLFFANGRRIDGFVEAAAIEAQLEADATPAASQKELTP